MPGQQQEKIGGGHKANAAKRRTRERYNRERRCEKNRIKRIRQSSGLKAAVAFAHEHMLTAFAKKAGLI